MGSHLSRFGAGTEAVFVYIEVSRIRKRIADFVKIATFVRALVVPALPRICVVCCSDAGCRNIIRAVSEPL